MKSKQNPRGSVNRLPEYLEPQQIETLIEFAADQSKVASNFILTMWRAGLRISEACALNAEDLKFASDAPQIHVRHGKGNKERFVPAHPELLRALKDHIQYTRARGKQPVFMVERTGQRPSRVTGWQWTQRAYVKALRSRAITPDLPIHPHIFRHSAARHWLTQGVPINVVQLWLGHQNLSTSLIYLSLVPDQGGVMLNVA
jgi:integrase/recombinase XerD